MDIALAKKGSVAQCTTNEHSRFWATCGICDGKWCDRCDPVSVSALCHFCHGRGYSHATIALPRRKS